MKRKSAVGYGVAVLTLAGLLIVTTAKVSSIKGVEEPLDGVQEEVQEEPEPNYITLVETKDIELTYQPKEYQRNSKDYTFDFDIKNYQPYDLSVTLTEVTLDGVEGYTITTYGEVSKATTKPSKGYATITVTAPEGQPSQGVPNQVSFNISVQSPYKEFSQQHSVIVDLTQAEGESVDDEHR